MQRKQEKPCPKMLPNWYLSLYSTPFTYLNIYDFADAANAILASRYQSEVRAKNINIPATQKYN
jgi:hypothetical protein